MSLLDAHPCTQCDRRFATASGLSIHVGRMHKVHNIPRIPHQADSVEQKADHVDRLQDAAIQNHLDELPPLEVDIIAPDGTGEIIPMLRHENPQNLNVLGEVVGETIHPVLPPHPSVSIIPSSAYNNRTGAEFVHAISTAYDTMTKWKKNVFKLPSGKAAKDFISELSTWLEHFNNNSAFQGIALKVFMTMPSLMLQKPNKKSKAKEHLRILELRMAMWKDGRIEDLLKEGAKIQQRINSSKKRTPEDTARIFSKLMFGGKVNAALKLISDEGSGGVLDLNDSTMKDLQDKHPPAAKIQAGALLEGQLPPPTPASYFDCIDEQEVLKAAQLTKGAGGPSQLDADQYRHILISSKYKAEGKRLREQIAQLARKLASEIVDPKTLEAFVACRLIPLDKCPGIRPIGIGEILRRIIGKTIGWALKEDIQQAAGPLQAATGLQGGAEAAIHAMKDVFESEETEAVILVDASNAFNRLNRQAALHNMKFICPPFATILTNTYRQPSRLFVAGGKELLSREGSTQGDNLAGSFYALGTIPLQTSLRNNAPNAKQVWLADDATGAGKIPDLKGWWDTVIRDGPKFGYYVNESKSWLILKDPSKLQMVKEVFAGSDIKITTEGKRHLGAALGSDEFRHQYSSEKVQEWCEEIHQLAEVAKTQPQAAYSAFTHGERHRFAYFMRTIAGMENEMKPLDDIINKELIPALLGTEAISIAERKMYALPLRFGGLALPTFCDAASEEYATSRRLTAPLTTIMKQQGSNLPDRQEVKEIRTKVTAEKNSRLKEKADQIELELPAITARSMKQATEKGSSSWLSVLPLSDEGFTLNKREFRDAIALRYNKRMIDLPPRCPCGEAYDINHALNCKRGGFVIMRHNNIRDFDANLLRKVCNDVEVEPQLQPLNGETVIGLDGDDARPDIRARGAWRPCQNAFFDVNITNANCASQQESSSAQIFRTHENAKKRNYNDRIMNVEHGTFTPLVYSVNGGVGPEAEVFIKHIADRISQKTGERYEKVIAWIRCKTSFLILRACLTCLRGSRSRSTAEEQSITEDFSLSCSDARLTF